MRRLGPLFGLLGLLLLGGAASSFDLGRGAGDCARAWLSAAMGVDRPGASAHLTTLCAIVSEETAADTDDETDSRSGGPLDNGFRALPRLAVRPLLAGPKVLLADRRPSTLVGITVLLI